MRGLAIPVIVRFSNTRIPVAGGRLSSGPAAVKPRVRPTRR
jgi:hypothetical protein